ncbi:calcium/sodium antiporter [Lentisphaerota bacterium ZTH]|nr:calcium/sodium antiporter [Lentisphaerota bacterium]WET07180.1 calcium/sodium antiporter [Lentisphaerota bacterium ZTH]
MTLAIFAVIGGLALLFWSADRFIDGAAAAAKHAGMSPLLIGMVVVGFGTSMPELLVSALSSWQGDAGLALGNAYGSNITNIALILGVAALINPITVSSKVLKRELPILSIITLFTMAMLYGGEITRLDGIMLLLAFGALMVWTIRQGLKNRHDKLTSEIKSETSGKLISVRFSIILLVVGLAGLLISSRMLVWGAVKIAHSLGVSDLIIGLTVVALGTSLPELASSIAAARKNQHDIALGNIVGSNLFNTLAVVGTAAVIRPLGVAREVIWRDWPVMFLLTTSLFLIGYGFKGRKGRINRYEATFLLAAYAAYTGWLIHTALKVHF